MEFSAIEEKVVLRRTDRDELGAEISVEHHLTLEEANELYNGLSEALHECRNNIVRNIQAKRGE